MLEIALATGFGSLRQFNRDCQAIFRAPPRELRARRRKSDRLVADGGLPLRLTFRGLLDWDSLVSYLEARAIPGVEHVSDGSYRRTIVVAGDPGVLELALGGEDYLALVAHLPRWEGLVHLVARARRIANLDFDLDEAAADLAGDVIVGPLLRARPGLRPPGTWDPFEAGVLAIVGQRVTTAGANKIAGRLVERFGTPVPGLQRLGLTHTFPSAATLAGADLAGLGLPRARQETIRSFACAVAASAIRLDGSVGLDDLIASLTAIDGLGRSTANYLALRLGERDAFPVTDREFRRARDRHAPESGLARLADRWRPWRALAATHISTAAGSREPAAARARAA
jgi:AraC family transcriptional regulator of adaptative response / DNA-3-methyladenine glycosylase II